MCDTSVAVSKWILYGSRGVESLQKGRRTENCGQPDTTLETKSQVRGRADRSSMTEVCLANPGSSRNETC